MSYPYNRSVLATAKPAGAHQRDVDALQARVRAEMATGHRELFRPAPTPVPQASENLLDRRIAEELELVVRQLEQLGGMLAADPILLHRHATQLQSIDLIGQVLGHLGRIVGSAEREAAVERVTLTELKGRLKRRPLRALTDEAA
jgi:hypothetical protein